MWSKQNSFWEYFALGDSVFVMNAVLTFSKYFSFFKYDSCRLDYKLEEIQQE